MIFLINRERVLKEMMELARLKIATALNISDRLVTAEIKIEDGKLIPKFKVDNAQVGSVVLIKRVIESVYIEIKQELAYRLKALDKDG